MTNEYSDFIKQDQTSDLRSALAVAAQRQPDTEAQLQKLAGRTGVPVDAVRMQRPEVELHDKLEAFDYERVIKDSPKLSAWMAKPDNAALAQDDWQTLSAMERGITHIRDYAGALGGGVVGDAIGRTLSGASTLLDVGARAIDWPVRAAFGDRVADAFWYKPTALDPFQSLKSTGQSLKAAGDWMKPPQERQTLGTDVAGGIGQIGGQIATHLLTAGTLTVPTLLAQGADVMADKTAKDIADPALKDTAIIAGGAITAITEKYGLDKLLNRVPPEVKNRTLRFMADKVAAGGIEAGQEFAEDLLHDIARRTLTNKDAELLDGVGREMTAAGLSAAIVRTALGVKGHARAKEQEQFVKALTDQAAESKLRERMPEKFREYLDQVTAGGPVENIFIPADQFATYYQSVGLDPAVEASKLGVQNFAEARAAGTDVVIPMADFVTQLSGSDHLQGLWQDLRFSQAEMTLREAAQYERNQDATPIDDEVLARYGAGDATTSAPGFQQVKEALLGELTGRFAPDVADAYATQYASVISTLAERSGIDPVVLAQQYDLSVDMPIPDALRQALERYDLSIDPLLDRLRSGDMPKDGEAFGASLADFVRNIGGLAPSGDVAWLDEQGTRKPGQRKLLQLDGLSVDAALQAAVEAGYFPGQDAGQLSVADMLNALAEDIGGNRVSSPMQETQAKADLVRGLRELENYLESIGADVSTMTNAQIKARMERSAAQEVAAQYDQTADDSTPGAMFDAQAAFEKHGGIGDVDESTDITAKSLAFAEMAESQGWTVVGRGDKYVTLKKHFGLDGEGYPKNAVIKARISDHSNVNRGVHFGEIDINIAPDDGHGRDTFEDALRKIRSAYVTDDLDTVIPNEPAASDGSDAPMFSRTPGDQTQTEAFKRWFKGSKVVDAGGKPLVVYHGTEADFSEFSRSKIGSANTQTLTESGFFFAKEPKLSDRYAQREGANVMPVYVSIQNPAPTLEALAETGSQYDGFINSKIVVAKNSEQIKSAIGNRGTFDPSNPNILFQADGDKRGQISIGQNRKMRISLFEKANLSTFLHETGHFYLEVMGDLAQRPESPQQLRDDYAAIRAWMGLKDGEAIAVEHHEMFARGNEAYLREGKAPSPELRMVFQKFKAWLLQIYRSLSSLNVELSDEMRQVFDRMYATDQQIDAARGEMEFEAMLLTAEDAGMTPAEFAAYEASVRQAVERGKEQLQAKLMGQLTREQQKWWKEQRANLREEVAAEVDAEPVYAAFKALTEGKTEDGIAAKLSRDALVEQYGKDFLKKMPRSFQRIYTAEGGMDADTAAEVFGFDSGPALLEALANMKPRREMIEAVTDARMVERHGDIRFDGTIADEAVQALHNDQRESVLKIELRAMRRKQAEVEPFIRAERQNVRDAARADRAEADAGAQFVRDALPTVERTGTRRDGTTYTFDAFDPGPMKRAAAGFIGQKMVRDLRPQEYLIASRKAARAAAKAMRAKDFMTAADQKQRELFNHYLYKEATRTVEEVQRKAEWLQKQGTDKKRQALGKAGADYLEQVDAILERYEFKRVPLNQLDRRQSLASWVDAQEAAGNAVSVPEDVLNEARSVNWKQIPVDELRGVHDAVQNITHLAGLKNSLLIKGQRRAFEEVKNELLSAIYSAPLQSTGELDLPNKSQANLRQKGAALWRNFDAVHIKVEQLVEWLDSGNIDGAWARNFFDLADQAQTAEYDLHRRVTVALNKLREDMPKGWQAAMADKLDFDLPVPGGRRQVPTRFTLLSIALNMGNEQNIQRLRDGNKFTDSDLARIRSALTADDMRFVQGVWDAIESLWPDMAALEKRASGLEPEKVVPTPLSVAGETYRGGYFPLVYDSRLSTAGEKQVEGDKSIEAFMASGFGRPTTNKGATKKRAEQVKQPVLLDMNEVIGGHVAKVVKDISHREAVMGLHRILTDDDIKTGLIDRLGEAHYRELRNWTQVLVNDRSDMVNAAKGGAAKIAMMARTNLAIVTMGWKISTMMSQFAGFGPAADLVKPSYLGSAMLRSLSSPRETWAMIAEKSGEMRNRVQTLDRDVRDSMRRLADKRSLVADVQRSAFILSAYADRIVTVPTWLGAYNQAMAEGLGEEAAIRAGDRAVRLSQGGGGAKDLAAVQRNNELMKLMTMYYTPFSALYARLRDVGHQQAVQGIGYLPTAVARTIGLVLIPALLGDYLAGRGPDDDEDEVWWAIRKMLLYPVASLPFFRDFSGLMEQKMIALSGEGKMDFQPSYQISPVVSAIGKAYNNLVNKPIDVAAGNAEFDEKAAWGMFESAGLVVGLPTAQVRITGGYLADLMSGEAEPENAAELMQGVLFRRKKE